MTSKGICQIAPFKRGSEVAYVENASSPDGYFRLKATQYGKCVVLLSLLVGETVITSDEALEIEIEQAESSGDDWDWD